MRSIKARINIGFVLISTITAIVTGGVSVLLCIQYTEKEAKEKLTLMVNSYAGEMELSLGKIKAYSEESCEKKGLTITLEVPLSSEDFQTVCDSKLIFKTVHHLVDNAIKFTKEGCINIGYTAKESIVEFYVKDTGVGIADEAQKRIFSHFTQEDTSDTRGFEGSGLGLSIAQGLVKLLKGEIWCESKKGKGSIFYFTIPSEKPNYIPQDKIVVANIIKSEGKSVILIAEDDEINYLFLKEIINSSSNEVIRAINGVEAVEICRNDPTISLVLMDLKMPVMDGFEATRQIKKIKRNLPVVAITAYAMSEDEDKAREAGCDDYISKPASVKKMRSIINKHLSCKDL